MSGQAAGSRESVKLAMGNMEVPPAAASMESGKRLVPAGSQDAEAIARHSRMPQLIGLVVSLAFFFTHTSSSFIANIFLAAMVVIGLRYLLFKYDITPVHQRPKASIFKQTSVAAAAGGAAGSLSHVTSFASLDGNEVSTSRSKSQQPLGCPQVEKSLDEFGALVIREFVTELWFKHVSPDTETTQEGEKLIKAVVMDIARRSKRIDLVNLLTRDVIFLFTEHLELYRRTRETLGEVFDNVDYLERDRCMKNILEVKGELHVALISSDTEYMVLKRYMEGLVTLTLRKEDAQNTLVRCLARELLTGAVMRPVLDLLSPSMINDLILASLPSEGELAKADAAVSKVGDMAKLEKPEEDGPGAGLPAGKPARMRGSGVVEVQMVSLEGEEGQTGSAENSDAVESGTDIDHPVTDEGRREARSSIMEDRGVVTLETLGLGSVAKPPPAPASADASGAEKSSARRVIQPVDAPQGEASTASSAVAPARQVERSASFQEAPASSQQPPAKPRSGESPPERKKRPRIRARLAGVEVKQESSSKAFVVYNLSVVWGTASWAVSRRYRNFETLHRRLKSLCSTYKGRLPPKSMLSNNMDKAFVMERKEALDKYIKELMSQPELVDSPEIFEFLKPQSALYGTNTEGVSVLRVLADNMDGAVSGVIKSISQVGDDIASTVFTNPFAQMKSTPSSSGNLRRVHSNGYVDDQGPKDGRHYALGHESPPNHGSRSPPQVRASSTHPAAAGDEGSGVVRRTASSASLADAYADGLQGPSSSVGGSTIGGTVSTTDMMEADNLYAATFESSNLSAPIYHLLDVVFELEGHGWLRRQILWLARQLMELSVGAAIDDWLLSHVQQVRKEENLVYVVNLLKSILFPNGIFFLFAEPKLEEVTKEAEVEKEDDELKKTTSGSSESAKLVSTASTGSATSGAPDAAAAELSPEEKAATLRSKLLGIQPTVVVNAIGAKRWRKGKLDLYEFCQSPLFLRMFTLGLLELLLVNIFPELQAVVFDVRSGNAPK